MNKTVRTKELFTCNVPYLSDFFDKYEFPWEMLNDIHSLICDILSGGIDGYTLFKEGVLVGENVSISHMATVEAPAIIGSGTEIRPGAFIRGDLICGRNCVLGNSSEFKNCILLDMVQAPHYNYVGDSILGYHAHMGAGAICSNLKSDGKNIIIHGDEDYSAGRRKIGGIIGDGAEIGCGSVLNPGCIIGKNTSVYPLTSVRGVIPPNCIVKSSDNIVEKIMR